MANVRKKHTTEYGVHATQVNLWKKQALAVIPEAFPSKKEKAQDNQQQDIDGLHRQIGRPIAERDWLKKSPQPSIRSQANVGWRSRPSVQHPATMRFVER